MAYYYAIGEPVLLQVPWNDDELSLETLQLRKQLASYNLRGVLTINSQVSIKYLFLTMTMRITTIILLRLIYSTAHFSGSFHSSSLSKSYIPAFC